MCDRLLKRKARTEKRGCFRRFLREMKNADYSVKAGRIGNIIRVRRVNGKRNAPAKAPVAPQAFTKFVADQFRPRERL